MYRMFVSEGVVVNKRAVAEANTLVRVLTKEFGLIRARAQNTRAEHSKLRYGLEPLTKGAFTFVRGKSEWRLVGVEKVSRELLPPTLRERTAAGRVVALLTRLIHGEEPFPQLYSTVVEGLASLSRACEKEERESIECVLVLRVLFHLGYLPHTPALEPFLEGDFFSAELTMQAANSRALLIRTINESLSATGL